ncbi:hypothetical protein M413DRAFT_10884 [Hebeloma cylindrosporum]|uniref:Uncharacterized protein n=1 Tax=Hebeloma cylindrosporum TaxID=76867 RepID=A0A0C2XU98_HEBCY|nr:hypothetical protein M413DRAFT_10884 [Hebeloma cylindrosporum h7]
MLEKLEVYEEFENEGLHFAKTWHLLGLSASSLTEIYISHTGAAIKPPASFNLRMVHNLRVFEYLRHSGDQYCFDASTDQTPSILLHLLSVKEPMEYLNMINIHFDLDERHVYKRFVLAGPSFPCLFDFEILFEVDVLIDDRSDFDKNAFLRAIHHFKSSFCRILARETIGLARKLNMRTNAKRTC